MQIISEERVIITASMMASRVERPRRVLKRSPGVHVSAVIESLAVKNGVLKKRQREDFAKEYPLQMALGIAFEEFMASFYPLDDLDWQSGELCRDGIYGTPDGLRTLPMGLLDWECKRHASEPRPIDDCWMDVKQALAFGAMSGLRRFCHDILWVEPSKRPVITRTIWTAEEYECEAWWAEVLKEAPNIEPEGGERDARESE